MHSNRTLGQICLQCPSSSKLHSFLSDTYFHTLRFDIIEFGASINKVLQEPTKKKDLIDIEILNLSLRAIKNNSYLTPPTQLGNVL